MLLHPVAAALEALNVAELYIHCPSYATISHNVLHFHNSESVRAVYVAPMRVSTHFPELSNDQPLTGLNGTIAEEPRIWPFLSEPHFRTSLSSSSADNAHNSKKSNGSGLMEGSNAPSELTSCSVVGSQIAVLACNTSAQRDNAEELLSSPPPDEGFTTSAPQASQPFPLPILIARPPIPTPRLLTTPRLLIPNRGPLAGINSPDSPASPVTRVVDLTQQIRTISKDALTHGGFADIYWGEWERRSEDGQTKTVRMSIPRSDPFLTVPFAQTSVAIKLLRVLAKKDIDGVRARKVSARSFCKLGLLINQWQRLNRELYVWHRLDHPNIARMFGTSYHMGGRPVSDGVQASLSVSTR